MHILLILLYNAQCIAHSTQYTVPVSFHIAVRHRQIDVNIFRAEANMWKWEGLALLAPVLAEDPVVTE